MKIMEIVDRHGLPLAVSAYAANHRVVKLVHLCFDFYMLEAAKPENMVGDRAYDSDKLDEELREDGVEAKEDTGWQAASSLQETVVGGAFFWMASVESPIDSSLGVLRGQLSWIPASRLHWHPAEAILR